MPKYNVVYRIDIKDVEASCESEADQIAQDILFNNSGDWDFDIEEIEEVENGTG